MIPLAILIASGIDAARLKSGRWIILAASLCVALMIETILMKGQFYDIAEAKMRAATLDQKLPAHLNASTVIFVPVNTSEPSFMTAVGWYVACSRAWIEDFERIFWKFS